MRPVLSNMTPRDMSHGNCTGRHMGHVATHLGHSSRLSCEGHGGRSCILELGQESLRYVQLQYFIFCFALQCIARGKTEISLYPNFVALHDTSPQAHVISIQEKPNSL